jgi:hypothetical protein
MKLENFFQILFMLAKINEASFVRFLEDHLQRLIANNPADRYTPLIAALTALLNDYKTAIDQRNLNQALQESRTMTVDQVIAEFKSLISRKHVDITDIWNEENPVYQEFFPRGLDEYNRANKGNVGSLINRFIAACDIHSHDLPVGFATPFTALKTSYESGRKAQLNMIGNTDGNRLDVAEKRLEVAIQATKNVHTIALDYLGKPEAVMVYFDQSIIRKPVKQNGTEPEPDLLADIVAPKSSVVILHGGFDANTSLHIVNTGSVDLQFYTANMPEDPVPGNALKLTPGEEGDALASELGASGNLFLMAYNADAVTTGSYEVSMDEY